MWISMRQPFPVTLCRCADRSRCKSCPAADAGMVEPKDTDEWVKQIAAWDHENPLEMRRDKGMTPQMIMEGLNQVYDEVTYVTDVGQHQMWASQYLDVNKNKRMITSGGLGTMGFGFPAALGAKMGHRDRDVVCITGDGGFQMNMQEMATAVVQQTPITVCLLNNYYLGMVRQMQQLFYGKRYSATCLRRRKGCPEHCKGPNEKCPPYVTGFYEMGRELRCTWHPCYKGRGYYPGFGGRKTEYGCTDCY